MFGKIRAITIASLALLACSSSPPPAPVAAPALPTIKAACAGREGWSDPAPPAHVFGNTYMVGTCGIVSLLITTPEGHFLIDGATDEAAEGIAENVRKLGFDPKDIRIILATHEHLDHAGGLAKLKKVTGAKFAVREAARLAMETGLPQSDDPQYGMHPAFPGIKAEIIISNNEVLKIGNQELAVIATPGHSPGGTSYTWKSCDRDTCYQIVYADSLNAVSADAYRFSDHPEYYAKLIWSQLIIGLTRPCDIMISPHPGQSNFFERLSGEAALVDDRGCSTYANAARKRLDDRIAKEAGAKEATK